jgi:hypothetical protein
MIPYSKDYIATGDVFADELIFCIRCGIQMVGLGYKEMPSVNDPKKIVNVAHKKQFGNYRQMPVIISRRGRESITSLPCCQECLKEIDPSRDTDEIVRQIKRAMQIEARYVGMPDEAVAAIAQAWADARIIRKCNPEEAATGRIMEAV